MFDPEALEKLIRESSLQFRENAISYIFTCPRCSKPGKLAMYKESGNFVCHHCKDDGYKGRPEIALRDLLGMNIVEVRNRLYSGHAPLDGNNLNIVLKDIWNEEDGLEEVGEASAPHVPEIMWPPDYIGLEDPQAFVKGARYLHGRGISAEMVKAYGIRYSPMDKRVAFPVIVDGKLAGYQARYIGPTEVTDLETGKTRRIPKILTSDSLRPGGRFLMFQDRLKDMEHCVLAEGPVSALKAHLCGGNVAAMGKDVTPAQLAIIRRTCRKLYLALDPDAAAAIMRMIRDLYDDMEVYLMVPPQNRSWLDDPANDKDLGDLSIEEVLEIFMATEPEPRGRLYISVGGVLAY